MRVLFFGTYSKGPGYPRTHVLIESLREAGVDVVESHVPLFQNAADKCAATSTVGGLLRFGARAAFAWARLAARYYRAGPRDLVVVGYTGHLDVFLARALSAFWRCPVVLDAFLSPWDTVVNDRKLLKSGGRAARALFGFERTALRTADLVLTDTAAHADFMAGTFGVPRSRFVPVPVGSLVRALVASPAQVPVSVATSGKSERASPRRSAGREGGTAMLSGSHSLGSPRFTAFFCGSFVPLQGVPYILDAAANTPDIFFRIVGDGVDGPRVEEEVKRRGMANVELIRRFISRDELEGHLAKADAVLGIFGTTAKAGRVVPCKVYDGLAAGQAVVTGDSPAARALLEHGRHALLVDRDDPRTLGTALRRLRDEPGLAARLRDGARRVALERFSKPVLGRRLRAAFAEVVR